MMFITLSLYKYLMTVHVYHGTNSKILDRIRQNRAISPFKDPIIENARTGAIQAVKLAGATEYRARMLERRPSIYVASKSSVAESYGVCSPEMLITALNLLKTYDPQKAREIIDLLEADGWMEVKPLVLKLEIFGPAELGLPTSLVLEEGQLDGLFGATNERRLDGELPIERIVDVTEISTEHMFLRTILRILGQE